MPFNQLENTLPQNLFNVMSFLHCYQNEEAEIMIFKKGFSELHENILGNKLLFVCMAH